MKIWRSKPSPTTGRRHIVLDMSPQESSDCYWILRSEVLRGMRPKFKASNGRVRYRFNEEHLEKLILTFPFAELSPGMDNQVRRAETVEIEDVPELELPGFKGELYDYQKVAVGRIVENDKFMLNDSMGLGKSPMALAAVCELDAIPALIICPNSAKWTWERFVQQFTEYESIIVNGTRTERQAQIAKHSDFTIINYEALRLHPEMADYTYRMVIVDEFHKIKNPKAKMTRAVKQLKSERWLMMSGTPIINRVEESYSTLNKLWPDRFPSMWLFEKAYLHKNKYGKVVGYKNLGKLKSFIHDPRRSIRRRKDQVLSDLPEVTYMNREVDLLPETRALYREILEEAKLRLEDGEVTTIAGMLALITRLKQAAFSPELYGGTPKSAKIDELKEIVQELVDNGEKAIIFSQWSKATRIIQRELADYNPAYVDGSVKGRDRQAQVDRFNNDPECLLYIGTIAANQEAITLGAATYVIFTDKAWSPLANEQAIGRSAAGGLRGVGVERVTVVDIMAHDTIEQRIEELLRQKKAVFDALYERDGGVKIKRNTLQSLRELFE